ncbi:MAG: glycine oxidase [Acidobacteriota bacterium]|jgi:glycine oxidase|nr:glycine oxidase [Acidobacteriota bacterium]
MRNHQRRKGLETADVVVAGGGVIGLAIARALALRGIRRVTLIERSHLGAEASSAAAGMLAPQAEANRDDAFFKLTCASRDLYPKFAEDLCEETGTDIELERSGTLYLGFTENDEQELNERYEWQVRAGLEVERLTADEARRIEPCLSPRTRTALRFPLDVQVENRRLVAALANSLAKHEVNVMTETSVDSLVISRGRISGIETSSGRITAPVVVLACGAWTSLMNSADKAAPGLSIEPVRGQMLCFETNPRLTRHIIYSPRGYLVPRRDGRLLAGSTTEDAGFNKDVTAGGISSITQHSLEISPAIGDLSIVDSWAGLRPHSADDLPVLGECHDVSGLFYATGHYRNGILLAPITGELIADEIMTNVKPLQSLAFSPDRFAFVGAH